MMRSLGVIIGCGVTWLILLIVLCAFCWKTSIKDRTQLPGDESPGSECHYLVKLVLIAIPFAMFLGGCLFVLIAHYNLNPIFDSAVNEVQIKQNQVNSLVSNVNALLNNRSLNLDSAKIQDGINDLENNVDFFASEVNSIISGRVAMVWFTCGFAIFTGILGCIYAQCNNGCLFEWFCAFSMLLILGSCVTIAVLDIIADITVDICNELYYQDGLLELWQAQLVHDIQVANDDYVDPQINNNTNDACNNLFNMCQMACCTSTCAGTCDTNSLVGYLNRTISDNGNPINVSSCATQCTTANLKSSCSAIVGDTVLNQFLFNFQNSLDNLTQPLTDPSLNLLLRSYVCNTNDVGTPISEIWVGCALFIAAAIIMAVLCVLLRGNSDGEGEEA